MIYHIAEPEKWRAAQRAHTYTESTRGRTLAEVGFIHCAEVDQVDRVLARYYGDYPGELVLLTIDPRQCDSLIIREAGDPVTGDFFPHIHGPLNVNAVVSTRAIHPPYA